MFLFLLFIKIFRYLYGILIAVYSNYWTNNYSERQLDVMYYNINIISEDIPKTTRRIKNLVLRFKNSYQNNIKFLRGIAYNLNFKLDDIYIYTNIFLLIK